MSIRSLLMGFVLAALSMIARPGFAACVIGKVADLPVRVAGLRALMPVKINGLDASLVVDSGAFFSMLSPAGVAALKLKTTDTSQLSFVRGVNGAAAVSIATVDHLVLDNIPLRQKVPFLVGGTDPGGDAVGLLGENIIGLFDAEYDLGNGVMRLLKPSDCGGKPLAYWAHAANLPVEMLDMEYTGTSYSSHISGTALLNGHSIRVVFDTGAPTSELTLEAARRAGVTPDSPGVVPAGTGAGLGRTTYRQWIGPFGSFELGGEEARNTRLRFADFALPDGDMLLGMDFFLSHRIYVASSQHKVYFTYNGGPVFNLTAQPSPSVPAAQPSEAAPQREQAQASTAAPSAADLAARGRALLARRDFEHAIADLTQACQIDPTQPEYFYQRAVAYFGARQPEAALTDLDQALKLQPDYVDALVSRARFELFRKEVTAARADLDAADRAAPKESDLRFGMANLYRAAGQAAQSVHQLDLWIAVHGSDAGLPAALNERCWSRMLLNTELDMAEADCKEALHQARNDAAVLDSLGWVEFRRGRFEQAIQEFNLALRQQPKLAAALYGRGIAELRLGNKAAADTDIAAGALASDMVERLRSYGISP